MNLIKINLLPYREQREMKQKQQFKIIMVFGVVVGALACGAAYMTLEQMNEGQQERNTALEGGIEELKKQVTEIHNLEVQKQKFLDRKRKVEELDYKRFDGARIVDSLNQVVPNGVYLTALKGKSPDGSTNQVEREYMIEGKALSDNRVALLMGNLPSTGVFELPELVEIQKDEDAHAQKFVLRSNLVDQIAVMQQAKQGEQAAASSVQGASSTTSPPPASAPAPVAPASGK